MNASNRKLLAIALAAALLSPAALAQKGGKGPPELPRAPTQTAPVPNLPEQTLRDQKPVTRTTEQTNTTLPPPAPQQSQGAEHAAQHSSVVQRDVWARLDTDADGRISTSEGAADAGFNTDFATMDSDRDGFVTDTEYRTAAKAEADADRRAGSANTSSRSASGMRDPVQRLDTNADGSISLSEADADASFRGSFSAIDSNSDGLVSSTEYRVWLKANRK